MLFSFLRGRAAGTVETYQGEPMTITFFQAKARQPKRIRAVEVLQEPDEPEFDEDGRRYVFRYPRFVRQQYRIDRERWFQYMRTHRLPTMNQRRIVRDNRNTANFYEDIREIQTHADVEPNEKARSLYIAAAS
jgi:hypothetical protein